MLGALLAVFLQQAAIAVAGLIGGGYVGFILAGMIGWDAGRLVWVPIIVGGILGVMTGMLEDWGGFVEWHYHFDATHICYYSPRTMGWLARRFGWELELPRDNVAIFRKGRA